MYRSLFALLASDEKLHDSTVDYPSFGDSATEYTAPTGATRAQRAGLAYARDFYGVWTDFATSKRFEWVGKWDVERGDDRGIRRLMEKENKKTRDDYRKEYNEAVRVRPAAKGMLMAATRPFCSAPRPQVQSTQGREEAQVSYYTCSRHAYQYSTSVRI